MNISKYLLALLSAAILGTAAAQTAAPRLPIGTSSGLLGPLGQWNRATFDEAKRAGIDAVEINAATLFLNSNLTDDRQVAARCRQLRRDLRRSGLQLWSVHMPYGKDIDLSNTDPQIHDNTMAIHRRVLRFCKILRPHIVLFHPSWNLPHNVREERMAQLAASVRELLPAAHKFGATVVIENMLGYELVKDENYERPLCRSVEEVMKIMSMMPDDVYAAVDMNHIDNPERLVSALGTRLRTIHVSDGDGRTECHELPWHGRGDNDWVAILKALYEDAHYDGVFMYELKKAELPQLKECYDKMYRQYLESNEK